MSLLKRVLCYAYFHHLMMRALLANPDMTNLIPAMMPIPPTNSRGKYQKISD